MSKLHRVSVCVPKDVEEAIMELRNKNKDYAYAPTSKILLEMCRNGIEARKEGK